MAFPHDLLVPLNGGLTAWIRGDSRKGGCYARNASMSERDHGATDGLHLGDAGGEEKRCDEGNSPSWRGLYRFERSSWLTTSPRIELKV